MIYAALIENEIENEILLYMKIEPNEQVTWSLPHLSSDDNILNDYKVASGNPFIHRTYVL
jgi:hypothetical protein